MDEFAPIKDSHIETQLEAVAALTAAPTITLTPTATGTQPFPSGEVVIDYSYDPLNRLTNATYSTGLSYAYTYDEVGNRLSQRTVLAGRAPLTSLYTYDDANRLATVNGVPQLFDGNGNLRSDGINSYTYDAANRLTSTSGQGSAVSYVYDGLGERVQQIVGDQTTPTCSTATPV